MRWAGSLRVTFDYRRKGNGRHTHGFWEVNFRKISVQQEVN